MTFDPSAIPWKKLGRRTALFLGRRLHLPVVPFLLVLVLESLQRTGIQRALDWLKEHPNEFALNYWIALFITLLTVGVIGRTRLAYGILFAFAGAVGLVSGMTMNATGLPLLPWSLLLPGHEPDPVTSLNPSFTRSMLPAGAAAVSVLLVSLLLRNVRLRWQERILYAAAALFLLSSVYMNSPIAFWDEFNVFTYRYEQEFSYTRNGFLASTMDNLNFVAPVRPAGAGDKSIRKLVSSLEEENAGKKAALSLASSQEGSPTGPNVIVLLSESFWDPTLLPEAAFSEDPIPFFHSLMDSTTSGWMLSPQFSGTTANVEFEVLTGNSVRFLPKDSIAYISYMNRGVDSLAGIFARQGYTTTAINPYFNWFFNSRNVYRNMGFSRFISCEFFESRFHGPNYEDSQVMEKIIEATATTPGPDFIFANTMENHGSYEDKFTSNPISVSGSFSAKVKNMLENYATGAQAFDKAFQTLVEHYKNSGEPTVILAFGDHLPGLGYDYLSYKETGYITGRNDADLMDKVHYTPFVIWDNMQLKPKESLRMNASFLGPYLLHYMDRPGSYYTDFLYGLYQKQPIIPIRAFRNKLPMDETVLADYKKLQYDILFGRQEGYKVSGIRERIIPQTFELGYGKPRLDSAYVDKNGKLAVEGGRFSKDSTVWLNNMKLDTGYEGPDRLTADLAPLPKPYAVPWHIQVKLADRKNTVICQSDVLVEPGSSAAP
jgi:hypothetical protein